MSSTKVLNRGYKLKIMILRREGPNKMQSEKQKPGVNENLVRIIV